MRLICPNCGAQYNVSDDAIPSVGRDVECSSCGHSWFQPGAVTEAAAEHPPAPEAGPIRRSVDASIAEILRQEAAREQQLRNAEAAQGQAEPQESSEADAPPADKPIAPEAPAESEPDTILPAPAVVTPRPAAVVRADPKLREMPSMSEINANLRAQSRRAGPPQQPTAEVQEAENRHGFRRGFALVLLLFALLLAPYIFADQISGQFPQLRDIMSSYVAAIDGWRLTLNHYAAALSDWAAAVAS